MQLNSRKILCIYREEQPVCFHYAVWVDKKKFLVKPFSIIIKKQLLQVKNCFHLLKPFYTLCRWSSKLKYILLCNEGIIKMWSHKRESDYNHYNRCLVYTSDCITSCKAKLWYMPLPPTADNNVEVSWEVKSSRTLYLWTIWCSR